MIAPKASKIYEGLDLLQECEQMRPLQVPLPQAPFYSDLSLLGNSASGSSFLDYSIDISVNDCGLSKNENKKS